MSTWTNWLRTAFDQSRHLLSGAARTTFYATVGVVDVAQEELAALRKHTAVLADDLTERGQTTQTNGEEQLNDLVERGQTHSRELFAKINKLYDHAQLDRLWPVATVPRMDEDDRT